ncbi:golgin subfamily A member 8M [Poecilia reticulata]|uniref:golgin subfamily A member 8M n=1 Tax=Poecilia reticulata TaxID=8081 RepID=UPI0004A2796C|nr:PREDICTED: golgin subfamily A member 8M-like [Poecilia reticulata]
MNWDSQLNSILSVADGSVAKMRERLTSAGKFPKGAEVKGSGLSSHWDPPPSFCAARPNNRPPSSLRSGVQWADLAAIQSQLQIQSQLIESFSVKLNDLEREKQSQQYHIQTLQEEVRSLRGELRKKDRERADLSSEVERRMEQWRREVGRELSSLARGNDMRFDLKESFGSKLGRDEWEHLRRELERLRRELDALKTQMRRQEEDMQLQQTEARETRRQCEHSRKTLVELTGGCRTHSCDLMRTLCRYSLTQQEVHQMRSAVSELKSEVRSLFHRGQALASPPQQLTSGDPPLPAPRSHSKGLTADEADSDSEDFSPTPTLSEISSDDLSWLEDKESAQRRRKRQSAKSTQSDFTAPKSDVEDDGDDDLLDDEDACPELESDLSLTDL